MITFSKLEKKGHLGNQLFQIAATAGIAKRNNQDFCFPKWSFSNYFEYDFPIKDQRNYVHFQQSSFHFEAIHLDDNDYDLEGWFQSEKFFDIAQTRKMFAFRTDFLQNVKTRFASAFSRKTILISIRRGDFVDHPDYFQLPINYYINALLEHFPDWENHSLIFFSDDISYCKFHFSFLENAYFGDSFSAIEQMAIASLCEDFIISNSTFSWWSAWLGEKEGSKIIRPLHYFTPSKNRIDNEKDYFPERWTVYDHLDKKIDLGNTFVTLKGKDLVISAYLQNNFSFQNANNLGQLNEAENATTLMINDAILPPFAIYFAVFKLRDNVKVHSFLTGHFLKISPILDYPIFKRQFDFGIFTKILGLDFTKKHNTIIAFAKSYENEKDKRNSEFIFYSHSGKIQRFAAKYYTITQKQKAMFIIKKVVKTLIRYKKK
ncbi:MAG: alpha-1,2-fucosyltransferase [Flavobacterium sp.]|nr:alpha-1,2-fucosyltransferase [Flavobacterium sp.]